MQRTLMKWLQREYAHAMKQYNGTKEMGYSKGIVDANWTRLKVIDEVIDKLNELEAQGPPPKPPLAIRVENPDGTFFRKHETGDPVLLLTEVLEKYNEIFRREEEP